MSTNDIQDQIVTGNYFDKYRSKNPIHRHLMARFISCAKKLLATAAPTSILEVGAGPGDLADALLTQTDGQTISEARYCGTDISQKQVELASRRYPHFRFKRASVFELPFQEGEFDLCIACEIFEHLDDPQAALEEIARVTSGHILISVPWEPIWRIANLTRGKYVGSFGNTPGHVQHFGRGAIRRLVGTRFNVLAECNPLPWTMLLAERPV